MMTNRDDVAPPSSPAAEAPNPSESPETLQVVRYENVSRAMRRDERQISADDLPNGYPHYRYSDSSSSSPMLQVLNDNQENTKEMAENFAVMNDKMNEEMNEEIKEIKHQLDVLGNKLTSMDSRLDTMDGQLDGMDRRLNVNMNRTRFLKISVGL